MAAAMPGHVRIGGWAEVLGGEVAASAIVDFYTDGITNAPWSSSTATIGSVRTAHAGTSLPYRTFQM